MPPKRDAKQTHREEVPGWGCMGGGHNLKTGHLCVQHNKIVKLGSWGKALQLKQYTLAGATPKRPRKRPQFTERPTFDLVTKWSDQHENAHVGAGSQTLCSSSWLGQNALPHTDTLKSEKAGSVWCSLRGSTFARKNAS